MASRQALRVAAANQGAVGGYAMAARPAYDITAYSTMMAPTSLGSKV
jgi:hypothetical protein